MAAGVDRILAVGSDLVSSETAIALAHRFDSVYAAVGIHPHETAKFATQAATVRALLVERKVVAVGEIGLDYQRGSETREAQMESFREQLNWAREACLPVSVHNRGADQDILAELRPSGVDAVLHCFSGTVGLAREAVRAGHWVSFAGNVTFPKASELRDVAAAVPRDRVLVETDAPVLAPQAWRGKTNEPGHVTATARVVAEVRGETYHAFCASVSENADRVFHWRDA
jgi:TatD DNase family protein